MSNNSLNKRHLFLHLKKNYAKITLQIQKQILLKQKYGK